MSTEPRLFLVVTPERSDKAACSREGSERAISYFFQNATVKRVCKYGD